MRNLSSILILFLLFSLVFSAIFAPLSTNAGLLSFLSNGEAKASPATEPSAENSQNIALLQANAFSAPTIKDKEDESKSSVSTDGIISDNALRPTVGAFKSIGGADGSIEFSPDDISIYVVRKGDTLSQIASMYSVSTNTILWANDMKKSDKIKEGDLLFILPVSGVKHIVGKGESLNSIAKKYKVDTTVITGFNGISADTKLAVGDELIIPDAQMPSDDVAPKPRTSSTPNYASSSLKNISGYFINPVPGLTRRSQNLHGPGNRGVDLAAPTGTKILASASGKVLLARTGYNGGYGSMVIIEHLNGTKTLYAHMSKIGTTTGAVVVQGEVIGYVGSTGRSTGPHLHFEVFNAKNPGSDWSWKPF